MIWAKTEAGRAEVQGRALIKERALRSLLLLVDGQKSQELLTANLAGITAEHFNTLHAMGLIEPVVTKGSSRSSHTQPGALTQPGRLSGSGRQTEPGRLSGHGRLTEPAPLDALPELPADTADIDYSRFAAALTQLIAKELGLRGFSLTLALEKASTSEHLLDVARRTLQQIADRKGAAAAEQARRVLFRG